MHAVCACTFWTHYGPTRIYGPTGHAIIKGRHSWHSGAHPQPLSSPGRVTLSDESLMTTGRAQQPEDRPRRRGRRRSHDSNESVAGRPEQLADLSRSDLALRGLNDYASTGSGPTRQSDARDSEPLHVSVAGTRAGSLLLDSRSFFLCDADLSEVSRQNVSNGGEHSFL